MAVVAICAGVLLVGSFLLLWITRGPPPIAATLQVSPEGADVLELRCDPYNCKDGTTVAVDSVQSIFAAGQSTLQLTRQLPIGDNRLALHIDRPGWGRDEVIEVLVPVAFRIRADVSTMRDPSPAIVIRVSSLPDSEVVLDGRPLPLDGSGSGTLSIDESAAATGPADESRVVAVNIGYSVKRPGAAAQVGSVEARVAIAPLRVDSPAAHATVDRNSLVLAGRAAKGSTVTVEGTAAVVAADGGFEATVPLEALGSHVVLVRAGTAALTPRTVRIEVKRVPSLLAEARTLDRAKTVGYDAVRSDPVAYVGKPVVVEGEVVDARASGHRVIALVDDRRGCAKGPCLARVTLSDNPPLGRGALIRAYGHVAEALASAPGQAALDVDADFFVPAKP